MLSNCMGSIFAKSSSYTKLYFCLLVFCLVFVLFGYIYTSVLQQDMKLLQQNIATRSNQYEFVEKHLR